MDLIVAVSHPDDCPICGWDAATVHTQAHQDRCARWQRALRDLSYKPMVRAEAEQVAEAKLKDLAEIEDEEAQMEAAGKLARAFYDRSLGHAIDNNHHMEHPRFETYASMLDLDELPAVFRRIYPLQPGHIGKGFTFWEPADSKARRIQLRAARH